MFLRFGIKTSILTGAVYYTIDQGLWEDTDKADKVYGELYQAVVPYVKEVSVEVNCPVIKLWINFSQKFVC